MLELPFTEVEVQAALMGMNGDQAPGPNGFTLSFWQSCWDFVKEEILEMFKEFYDQNVFLKSLNNTFWLKKVIGKVVSPYQNAFVTGRQILDASLIAMNSFEGYGKMGFGSKWLRWMWWCISTAKFSVMVNGVPTGFFSSSKGPASRGPPFPLSLCHGNGMLSVLIRRAVEGGFISGSASGLRINLAKSEIIPIGDVEEVDELAVELGCRVGQLPAVYLGLPLGVSNKAVSGWDVVEEKVRRRLALWKRQYISKGGESLL
ncbi:hypothetical protein CK203_021806 [Vitis vinifera]|uniref:Reverse transcriptase domain-containing protein n=1 Tax=Vitis vinifera TaxID=29760 RepID=A0A438JFQ5_VITVI|nr:hypothetical protein CK203_021806 [Vitis vinifera]